MAKWRLTIRLADLVKGYRADEYDVKGLAEQVAARIRATRWSELTEWPTTLEEALDDLKTATTEAEYREKFDTLYDIADDDLVWIETH